MAEKSVTPPGFPVATGPWSACPRMAVPLPDFPEVVVELDVYERQDDKRGIEVTRYRYSGWLDALIVAGVLTDEMLATPPKRRLDAEGFHISIENYWRLRGGRRERYYKVRRTIPAGSEHQLPGAQAALEAAENCWELENKWWTRSDLKWAQSAMASAEKVVTTVLRRIADNTRPSDANCE